MKKTPFNCPNYIPVYNEAIESGDTFYNGVGAFTKYIGYNTLPSNAVKVKACTIAERFQYETQGKYIKPEDTLRAVVGPLPWQSSKGFLCQYTITWEDLSTSEVVLTRAQYNGFRRSIWNQFLKTIGGKGYRKPIIKS